MAWTGPRTWVTGELVTSTIMNAHVRDNLAYLFSTTGELAYNEITSTVGFNQTVRASAVTIITATAVVFDGSTPALIEVFVPQLQTSGAANQVANLTLWEDSTDLGAIAVVASGAAANSVSAPVHAIRRRTPASGSRTYSLRGYGGVAGTNNAICGAGGSGTFMPAFLRVVRTS